MVEASTTISGSYSIRNGTKTIADSAFSYCDELTEITIPDSVTTIGEGAFADCSGLEKIIVEAGNTVYSSKEGVLYNKEQTNMILVPSAIKVAVIIPNSVTSIRVGAFLGCNGLTEIKVDSGNQNYCMQGDCLIEIKSKTLIRGCNRSQIPDDGSVTSIRVGAFQCCSGLTEITIPNSVTEIGEHAFENCSGLRNVYFENPNGWTIEGAPISGLENPAKAAQYLTNYRYNMSSWKREG